MFDVILEKQSFKFSAAHFTVFSADNAERLHGHNYYVRVVASFESLQDDTELTADFSDLKKDIQKECDFLDEYVLIPENSPFMKIDSTENSWKFAFGKKPYELPKEDVRLLPVKNVTCESLTHILATQLKKSWSSVENLSSFRVTVQETQGQSVETQVFFKEVNS